MFNVFNVVFNVFTDLELTLKIWLKVARLFPELHILVLPFYTTSFSAKSAKIPSSFDYMNALVVAILMFSYVPVFLWREFAGKSR